jgi:hypothetical protein
MSAIMTAAEFLAMQAKDTRGRRWSAAKAASCSCGRTHASRLERTVCLRLTAEAAATGYQLRQQQRFPLLALPGRLAITVDFVLWRGPTDWRAVDAKPRRRKSRDWCRGAAAFQASYGRAIMEVDA